MLGFMDLNGCFTASWHHSWWSVRQVIDKHYRALFICFVECAKYAYTALDTKAYFS